MTLNKQNLSNGVKQESFSLYLTRLIFSVVITVSFGLVIAVVGYLLTKPKPVIQPPVEIGVSKIENSSDKKSILNVETREAVFTIEDTKEYLKDAGYEYNPETFQTTDAKYAGNCFGEAALSNKKDRIIFSTSCLPGDLPQSWIGVYNLSGILLCIDAENKGGICPNSQRIKFLIGGSGRNFVWSNDDKTITYKTDIGLSGMTETRTIDANTGEILEKKSETEIETSDWKTYRNEEYGFEIMYPNNWKKKVTNLGDVYLDKDSALPFMEINKFEIKNNQNFKDVMIENTLLGECGECHPAFKDFELRKINNNLFYYIFPYLSEGQFSVSYWIIKDDFVLEFQLVDDVRNVSDWTDPSLDIDEQASHIELNQILSTFKFIR